MQVVVAELTDAQDLRAVVARGLEGVVPLTSSSSSSSAAASSGGVGGGGSVGIDPGDVVALYLQCRGLAEVGFSFFWGCRFSLEI